MSSQRRATAGPQPMHATEDTQMTRMHFIWYHADGTATEVIIWCWQTDRDETTALPALARRQAD